jgi:ribonuclease HI
MPAQKVYAIFTPVERRGIYSTWDACQFAMSKCTNGKSFSSFKTRAEALKALTFGTLAEYKRHKSDFDQQPWVGSKLVQTPCLVVDAACSGAPGPVEYRGVVLPEGFEAFRHGPYPSGTNNVGEFLAIYTGLKWLDERSLTFPLYSDSAVAIGWILRPRVDWEAGEKDRRPRCRTGLKADGRLGRELAELVPRAEAWLDRREARVLAAARLRKWDTAVLGEIPADFGRK